MGRHIRGLDQDALTRLNRVLLPILPWLARKQPVAAGSVLLEQWQAVAQGQPGLKVPVPIPPTRHA